LLDVLLAPDRLVRAPRPRSPESESDLADGRAPRRAARRRPDRGRHLDGALEHLSPGSPGDGRGASPPPPARALAGRSGRRRALALLELESGRRSRLTLLAS